MAPKSRGIGLVLCTMCALAHAFAPPVMGSARRAHSSSPEDWVPSALRLHYSTSSREAEYPVQEHLTQEPKAQRAAASNSYSVWEMVVGPDRSDLALVNMPAELEEIAQRLLQSTRRSRKARLTILQALVRSYDAYRHQQRSSASSGASGIKKGAHGTVSEYMQRITSVAAILAESEVDYKTVVAALLCQSPLSLEEVERDFGKSVSTIIRGFQRMLEIENILEIRGLIQDYPKRLMGQEGDNLRNLLLSVAQDWRAVALRVAWTRIDMEGPFAGAREKVNRMYAALNIYASLAEKAGMNLIKNDLENKAFEYLMPEEHNRITAQLKEREERDLGVLRQASSEVRQALMQDEIFMSNTERFEVKARIKQPYSVWKKLSKNNCTLDELYDIVALRIVCSPLCEPGTSPEEAARRGEELCRYACSVVHKLRPHYPSRFKDYIQKPKQNGYQSLHTSLQMRLAGNSCPFEVQIRTHEMHQVAEYGLASHSIYKGDSSLGKIMRQSLSGRKYPQVKRQGDFLAWMQRVLVESQVYVLGPDGKLLNLSRGTTLSDLVKTYAFTRKLSKKVMREVRINGKRAFLGRTLNTGDVVSF